MHFQPSFYKSKCQKIPGQIGYLAQFNSYRASQRRQPQAMMCVRQAFDGLKFNFNKVDVSKELVFQVLQECVDLEQLEPFRL